MLQQQIPHVQDRTPRRLTAAAHNQGNERCDLFGRHDVTINLGATELGNDVEANLVAVVIDDTRLVTGQYSAAGACFCVFRPVRNERKVCNFWGVIFFTGWCGVGGGVGGEEKYFL